jgi:hypothetical protein
VITEPEKGGQFFRDHFLYWRLMMSAAAIGTGKGALNQLSERLKNLQVAGTPSTSPFTG